MQHLPTYCWSIFLSLKSITAMCCSSTRQGRTRRRPRSRAVQLLRHLVQHLGGRGPPPGHRDEQIARRLSVPASSRAVSLRAVRLMPRSRSLIAR